MRPFARCGIALVLTLGASCGTPPFPTTTQSNDARNHDPWLDGDACVPPSASGDDAELQVEEVIPGTGRVLGLGDTVRAHYTAATPGGPTIHDSRDSGPPVEIIIGSSKTICGFEKALVGMRAGGKRRVVIPARLAFGDKGKPPEVPPRADLVFVVDAFVPTDLGNSAPGGSPAANPIRGRRR